MEHRVSDACGQPFSPVVGNLGVQPGDGMVRIVDPRRGETSSWNRLVVAQRGENGRVGENLEHLLHSFLNNV